MNEELTYDQAVALLPEGDTVHTYSVSGGVSLGADWHRSNILEMLKHARSIRPATGYAREIGHGLVVLRHGGLPPMAVQTKREHE